MSMAFAILSLWSIVSHAQAELDLACSIRSNGKSVNCIVLGNEKRVMTPEDVAAFIDAAIRGDTVYVVMKSPRATDRLFKIDGKAPQFAKVREAEKHGSISEIAEAKLDLFAQIEKKLIKTAEDLDARAGGAELVLSDSGLLYAKYKQDQRVMKAELDGYRKDKENVCTTTPAFDQIAKANTKLQQTLSNLIFAFQSPESCMERYKVFKNRDGAVDLKQLESASDFYKENCIIHR